MNTLLASSALGVLWLVLLFAFCFIGVHIARLVQFGELYRKENKKREEKKEEQEPPKEKAEKKTPPPENGGEPIYYIVERKRKTKSSFSEPKQIKFK